ncbi:MAG: amidohydrolase family protein [Dehalococcoidia bacterium]|nr:amidohydrolase family protein [Dehalococcoidia bacterium]
MSPYLIIDCHIHTYPSVEMSNRDAKILGFVDKGLAGQFTGAIDDTLAAMKRDGVSKAIMANWLPISRMKDVALTKLPFGLTDYEAPAREIDQTLVARLQRRNQWTCEAAQGHPELIPFISVDPVMNADQIRREIQDRVNNHGARGIKLQYAGQRVFPHDRRLWPAYETAQELDVAILGHSGESEGDSAQYAEPKYFAEVLHHFPRLRLVLAHIGADFYDQAKALARAYPQINFDCSDILCAAIFPLTDAELVSLFREVGADRVVLGTDFPFYDRKPLLERLLGLDLTEQEKRQILGENALRIYRLGSNGPATT